MTTSTKSLGAQLRLIAGTARLTDGGAQFAALHDAARVCDAAAALLAASRDDAAAALRALRSALDCERPVRSTAVRSTAVRSTAPLALPLPIHTNRGSG